MPIRRTPFSFATLYVHLEAAMAATFPLDAAMPDAMRRLLDPPVGADGVTLTERLHGLKRLFDDEADRAEAAAAA